MMDYKKTGVDIKAGCKSAELMKEHVKGTMCSEVSGGSNGFSGAFSMPAFKGIEEPTLLSNTNSVGAKLKLALLMDKHDTVGIDRVAICASDVACTGGESLFSLDYTTCGKNVPEKITTITKGVAEGCRQSGSALIGGEIAEVPGPYPRDKHDLIGFSVDIVNKKDLVTGRNLRTGDVLIGTASSGVYSNDFSLVRKMFEKELAGEGLNVYYDELGTTLGGALLAPTKIYAKVLRNAKEAGVTVKACSYITSGGFYGNVPRMLKDGVEAIIRKDSYPVPPVFRLLADKGQIERRMMHNAYNMGLGMIVIVNPVDVEKAVKAVGAAGETPYTMGPIEEGERGVSLC